MSEFKFDPNNPEFSRGQAIKTLVKLSAAIAAYDPSRRRFGYGCDFAVTLSDELGVWCMDERYEEEIANGDTDRLEAIKCAVMKYIVDDDGNLWGIDTHYNFTESGDIRRSRNSEIVGRGYIPPQERPAEDVIALHAAITNRHNRLVEEAKISQLPNWMERLKASIELGHPDKLENELLPVTEKEIRNVNILLQRALDSLQS